MTVAILVIAAAFAVWLFLFASMLLKSPVERRAFWWGFTHPFGPPRPWWNSFRRAHWFVENGHPWESR